MLPREYTPLPEENPKVEILEAHPTKTLRVRFLLWPQEDGTWKGEANFDWSCHGGGYVANYFGDVFPNRDQARTALVQSVRKAVTDCFHWKFEDHPDLMKLAAWLDQQELLSLGPAGQWSEYQQIKARQ